MLDHPFRTLGALAALLFIGLIGWAVTLGGYRLDDPALEDQRSWVQGFKYDQPEAARAVGQECKKQLTRSPWTRNGAMELFTCIRTKAEARGYFYE